MEVQLGDLTKKEANLSIFGGDAAILNVIQDELLESPSTKFAGVITKHPLTDEIWMRVVSTNPLKDIIKATSTAIEDTAELKKLLVSKIKVTEWNFALNVKYDKKTITDYYLAQNVNTSKKKLINPLKKNLKKQTPNF